MYLPIHPSIYLSFYLPIYHAPVAPALVGLSIDLVRVRVRVRGRGRGRGRGRVRVRFRVGVRV